MKRIFNKSLKNKKIIGFILVITAIVIGAIFLHFRLIEKDKKEFNAKFEAYAGTNIQGAQVNKLIQEVSQVKNGELLITFPSSDGENQTYKIRKHG